MRLAHGAGKFRDAALNEQSAVKQDSFAAHKEYQLF